MTSDKYTKDFSDFSQYNYPGQITPNKFDHTADGGDGQSGLQAMIQGAMSAYGPRHIISGAIVQSGGTNSITGTASYFMWDGKIESMSGVSGGMTAGQYACISTGGLDIVDSRDYATGVIIGTSGDGTNNILNLSQRWSFNKQTNSYHDRLEFSQASGGSISGTITGVGNFTELTGTDFNGSQITGDSITGDVTGYMTGTITGVGNFNELTGSSLSGSVIEYNEANFNELTGSSLSGSSIEYDQADFISVSGDYISGAEITGTSGSIDMMSIGKLYSNINCNDFTLSNVPYSNTLNNAAPIRKTYKYITGTTIQYENASAASHSNTNIDVDDAENIIKKTTIYENISGLKYSFEIKCDYNGSLGDDGAQVELFRNNSSIDNFGTQSTSYVEKTGYIYNVSYGDEIKFEAQCYSYDSDKLWIYISGIKFMFDKYSNDL